MADVILISEKNNVYHTLLETWQFYETKFIGYKPIDIITILV